MSYERVADTTCASRDPEDNSGLPTPVAALQATGTVM